MKRTDNKIAFITGSSRGIGRAIALTLADDGFDIIIHCKSDKEKAQEVLLAIKKKGKNAHLVVGDITQDTQIKQIFVDISKITENLDLLVNNAGAVLMHMIGGYSSKEIHYLIDLTLTSKILITQYALQLLKKSYYPSIINIASIAGESKTIDELSVYAAAEAGVIKFTQNCALEFRKHKIRVNAVAPGLIDTDLNRNVYKEQKFWDSMAKTIPAGRVGLPQDIANVVSFLASEKASYINGATIDINGGSNLI